MTGKNKTTKFISAFLIILIIVPAVLFSNPKKAEAVWWSTWISDVETGITAMFSGTTTGSTVTNTAISIKNVAKEVLRQVAMAVARRALQEITKSTVNWINSGFHGQPLFLENPQSFFQDIAKSEVKTLVNQFGYDSLKFPFGKAWALNAISSYKSTLDNNAAYTLSTVMNDPAQLHNYQNNFNVGGWNGFLINTQYPQNNYLGFNMLATDELARQIAGTTQAPAQKIQSLLQQGQGFLSPQTCQTNTKYNTGYNEFNKPTFKYDVPEPIPTVDPANASEEGASVDPAYAAALSTWQANKNTAQATWADTNVCPPQANGASGLINTTPGSVVSSQITNAMGSQFRQSELGAAMGNSLSAVFDALLNHFIDKGLNSLASTINPPPDNTDNWSYDGQTLGSPSNNTRDVFSGPDQEIILSDFKKAVDDGIANTTTEILLMDNYDPQDPQNLKNRPDGITQLLGKTWPESRKLDICIPGPDISWEDRLDKEMQRNSGKLQETVSQASGEKSAESDLVLKELKFATNFFKDWINNRMMTELPGSILYMDAVNEVKVLSQQSSELTDARRLKTQALARLKAIKPVLDGIKVQPDPGTNDEKLLISLKKQYDATNTSISNTSSVENTQNELNIAKDRLNNLKTLIPKCETERKAKGWGIPGGRTSSFSDKNSTGNPSGTEQALFCDLPIVGGYTHETFINKKGVTYPELPLVNGENVLKYTVKTIKSFLHLESGTRYVTIKMSCNGIFNANILDYKGNLPGATTVVENYVPLPDDTTDNSGTALPADIGTKHGDHKAEVETAKNILSGAFEMVFTPTSSLCDRFEITKQAVRLINQAGGTGTGAGLLSNPDGDYCAVGNEKYAVDAVAFPDGYIYQVLDDTATDGNGPVWNPASCGTADGTCADLYRPSI